MATLAIGQTAKTVSITFAGEGDREVWIGPTTSPGDFVAPQSAQGTAISLQVPEKSDGQSIYVHDKRTGNVASRPIEAILKSGSWKVDAKDEGRIRALEFLVTSDGKPVASGVVRAKAGAESRQALITPSDRGKAVLYNLPVGQVQVTVDYKFESSSKSTPAQVFEAKLGAGPAKPKSVVIPDIVEVVADEAKGTEPVAKGGSEAKGASQPKEVIPAAPNPAVSFLNLILGLGVIAAIAYGILTYVKKNPKQFEDTLKKVGLAQVEPDATDAPPPPTQPQPLKQIMLGDAATATGSAVVSTPTAVRNPRLVKSDGSVVLLSEGENVVSRDDGHAVSLAGESSVSRQHARLDRSGDSVTLIDLGSTNGTFLNGTKLSSPVVLSIGDSVQFGAVGFRFEA